MTHTTVSLETENSGSQDAAVWHLNITSLDSAGTETIDPASEVGIADDDGFGLWPVAQTNSSVVFSWDETNQNLSVKLMSDGTDVANNGDPGEVKLRVVGGGT